MEKRQRILKILIIVVAALVCIKSVLVDFGFDQAYTVTMSYRHLRGDRMLMEMWDPLQTSMFVTDILMFLYHLIVPSFAGVAIYLNVCGTLIFAATSFLLYREVKEVSGDFAAFLSAVFFLVFRAKTSAFPDYTNLSVIFSALTFVCIIRFLKSGEKFRYMILSALFLCCQVLVYPSTVLVYVGLLIVLSIYSEHKVKNCLTLTGLCALGGGLYVGYFVLRLGFGRLVETVQYIVRGDSHGGDYEGQLDKLAGIKSGYYFDLFLKLIALAVVIAAVLLIIKYLIKRFAGAEVSFLPYYVSLLFVIEILYMVFWKSGRFPEWCDFGYAAPLLLILFASINYKKMNDGQKRLWITGMTVSVCTFFAAFLFSNMPFLYVLPFLVLGGAVSLASVSNVKKCAVATVIVLAMVLFKTGFYVEGYAQAAAENTVMMINVHNRTLHGPNAQVVSTWVVADRERQAIDEFAEQVRRDDKAFYVGGWLFDPILYLALDADISNPNTTDTPFYSESINRYFEMNPHKYPTVIVVEMSNGNISAGEDSWIMNWIGEEGFVKCAESNYWSYYRKP